MERETKRNIGSMVVMAITFAACVLVNRMGYTRGKQEGTREARTSLVRTISRQNWMGYPTYTFIDINHDGKYDYFSMNCKGKVSGEYLQRERSKEEILNMSMPGDLEFID